MLLAFLFKEYIHNGKGRMYKTLGVLTACMEYLGRQPRGWLSVAEPDS